MVFEDFYQDIKGNEYVELLKILEKEADIFSFVTRKDIGISHSTREIIKILEPYLLSSKKTNLWLTCEVINYKKIGEIYYYIFNEDTLKILLDISDSLFEWGNNVELPEDIAFLTKKQEPLLAVNGHEKYFFISGNVKEKYQ